MVQLAQEDGERLSQLTEAIRSPAIFTVSARDYMAIRGLSQVKSPKLDAVPQTEIDVLKQHLGPDLRVVWCGGASPLTPSPP
jgi:hypothetical protein